MSSNNNICHSMYDDVYQRWQSIPKRCLSDAGYHKAAVLVTLTNAVDPSLVFIQRSMKMPTHQGQVAFPGGKCEAQDNNIIATALRECEEEIGLPRQAVKVVGTLAPVYSRHAFHVTPVLGIIDPLWLDALKVNSSETDYIFTAPVSFFLNNVFPMQQVAVLSGHHQVPVFEYLAKHSLISEASKMPESFTIWGMTAFIVAEFLNNFYDAGFVLTKPSR